MKWAPKDRYELPGDPGFITRLWWAIEDWWRTLWWDLHCLDRIDYIMCGLGVLLGMAVTLMILTLRLRP